MEEAALAQAHPEAVELTVAAVMATRRRSRSASGSRWYRTMYSRPALDRHSPALQRSHLPRPMSRAPMLWSAPSFPSRTGHNIGSSTSWPEHLASDLSEAPEEVEALAMGRVAAAATAETARLLVRPGEAVAA